ncbi:LysR substrate-binding domain-containing protein [Methylobacterium nodulans]|uniref:Transcriptional regulator, LysR family n=1 Tax=Methylobacterium nodulans (strain LMG 21967 / CNCM I-2342 / ORS 2060) TaxID=460265 RepID=B8IP23_METNO|nr:LysR substrate-binding domain-containing protein [Methylobacterium nodulans]ACL60341.1 transcriptional regulator, LysR family [Methylobacterium nodulans ORS 2060]
MRSREGTIHSLDERGLRYLATAVSCGSVRAAADKLNINASAVSRQLAQMEAALATPLVERHRRGVRPTLAGSLLLDYYRRQTSDRDDTLAKLLELKDLRRGHIDVVLGEGFVGDLMSGVLQGFWSRYPDLTMTLDLAATNDVIRRVIEDEAHVGLVYNPPPEPRIRTHLAMPHPIRVVVRPDHPLAASPGPLSLRDLAGHRLGMMHPAYGIRQIIAGAERTEGVRLGAALITSSISVLKQFVAAADGVTLLPAFCAAPEIAAGTLCALPLADPDLNAVEAQIVTRLGRQLPTAAARFLQHLARAMSSDPPGARLGR